MNLLKVWKSDAFWRYVDAFVPRGFALILHTLVVWTFGASHYALAAWVATAFGLIAAFVPDPHSYLFVRAHGARAWRLSALMTPFMWAKAIGVGLLSASSGWLLTSPEIQAPAAEHLPLILAGASAYGMSEFLWTYAGVVGFASENTRKIAIYGVAMRGLGLLLAVMGYLAGYTEFGGLMLVYALPTLVGSALLVPRSWRWKRAGCCFNQALRTYAIWSQGISLSSAVISQLLPAGVGMLPGVSASDAGLVSYASRMLAGLMVPFQILQGVVVKQFSKNKQQLSPELLRYRTGFQVGAVGLFIVMLVTLMFATRRGTLTWPTAWSLLGYGGAAALYSWNRFELALRTTPDAIRILFIKGYGPASVFGVLASLLGGAFLGLYGLAVASTVAWAALSFSWFFAPLKAKEVGAKKTP